MVAGRCSICAPPRYERKSREMLSYRFSPVAHVAEKAAAFTAAVMVALLVLMLAPAVAHATEFTVTNTNNSGAGSLRSAISAANAATGADNITFNIPDNPNVAGLEVKTISPTALLPTITDTVTIDGYTQPGAEPNDAITNANNAVLKVELSGANAPSNAFGLAVSESGAAGTKIKGLVINRFADDGVFINAPDTTLEGNFI